MGGTGRRQQEDGACPGEDEGNSPGISKAPEEGAFIPCVLAIATQICRGSLG